MHFGWLFSLLCIYPSVLCKPQAVDPVFVRGNTDMKTGLKHLVIPIDLSNNLQMTPSQLINRAQVQPHVVVEHKPTHFFYQAQEAHSEPLINLEYHPASPFHTNLGSTLGQVVAPEDPWVYSPEDYSRFSQNEKVSTVIESSDGTISKSQHVSLEDRAKESSTSAPIVVKQQTPISLEYKPIRPFYHPNPGDYIAPIVPPGQPWPSNAEGYKNSTQKPPVLEDRWKETSTSKAVINTTNKMKETSQPEQTAVLENNSSPSSSLEYQPMRPFHFPSSGISVSQIVPPGKPWPGSAEGYKNISQEAPNLKDRLKETSNNTESSTAEKSEVTSTSQAGETSTTDKNVMLEKVPSPSISLEYKPEKPFYYPSSGIAVSQIVPPGKPWPANAEGYQNFNQTAPSIQDRIKDQATNKPTQAGTTTVLPKSTGVTLDYKPTRPFYHPSPGNNIGEIVPPGEPWPANAEDYQNFSQNAVSLGDRIKDTSESSTVPTTTAQKSTPINLEYTPTRPFYHPNPGDQITQIVPSGQPWPAKPEDYQNVTQVTLSLENKFKETSPNPAQVGFIWEDARVIDGSTVYTSNPDTKETSTSSESTQPSTTEEVSTDTTLFTSSLLEITKESRAARINEDLPSTQVVPETTEEQVTEKVDEKAPPVRLVPFNLLPTRYFDVK